MITGRRVLIVCADDWVTRLVDTALREHGAETEVVEVAEAAARRALDEPFDAVICDDVLPDHDTGWLVRRLRSEPTLGAVPLLVLVHDRDLSRRLALMRSGADCCVERPFRVEELCAQVASLVALARRAAGATPRHGARSALPGAARRSSVPPAGLALEGDVSQVALSTVLSVLEMERRTGTLMVEGARQRASVDLADGTALNGVLGGVRVAPLAVLRKVLNWKTGRFSFRSGAVARDGAPGRSIGALLMEAVRLDDELAADSRRAIPRVSRPPAAGETTPSRREAGAPRKASRRPPAIEPAPPTPARGRPSSIPPRPPSVRVPSSQPAAAGREIGVAPRATPRPPPQRSKK